LREARALTQEAPAAKRGLSRKTVQRRERGEAMRDETLAFVASEAWKPRASARSWATTTASSTGLAMWSAAERLRLDSPRLRH
jgi:hypothetical protein